MITDFNQGKIGSIMVRMKSLTCISIAILFSVAGCTSKNRTIKTKLEGNYELNLEIAKADSVEIFFSANEPLDDLACLRVSQHEVKIMRRKGDSTAVWKNLAGRFGNAWKIRVLKKGNFYRFWVNDSTLWIRGPMGEWKNVFEPWEAFVGVNLTGGKIHRFTATTLPWLEQRTNALIPLGGVYDEQLIPGALLEFQGNYYMYMMAGRPGDQEGASERCIVVAVSEDLRNWQMQKTPVLTAKQTTVKCDNLYPNGVAVTPEGRIALFYSAQTYPDWLGFCLALADHPSGPFRDYPGNPVYKHYTHAHEFDLVSTDNPKQRYLFFYAGFTRQPVRGPVGDRGYLLSSNDLIHWTPDPANPVFSPETLTDWDAVHIRPRSLNKIGDYWYLWYEGCNNWTPPDGTPCHGWWDTVGLARSKDLHTWEYYPRNPALPGLGISAEQFDNSWIGWPRMIVHNDTCYVFYTGNGQTGLRTIPVHQLTNWESEGGETIDLLNTR
jgi:hypothetical protein